MGGIVFPFKANPQEISKTTTPFPSLCFKRKLTKLSCRLSGGGGVLEGNHRPKPPPSARSSAAASVAKRAALWEKS